MTEKLEVCYLTLREVAEMLRISRSTLYALIQHGQFPAGIKLGRSRRWAVGELKKFLASQKSGHDC